MSFLTLFLNVSHSIVIETWCLTSELTLANEKCLQLLSQTDALTFCNGQQWSRRKKKSSVVLLIPTTKPRGFFRCFSCLLSSFNDGEKPAPTMLLGILSVNIITFSLFFLYYWCHLICIADPRMHAVIKWLTRVFDLCHMSFIMAP